jgi:hypothetical protein
MLPGHRTAVVQRTVVQMIVSYTKRRQYHVTSRAGQYDARVTSTQRHEREGKRRTAAVLKRSMGITFAPQNGAGGEEGVRMRWQISK